MKIKYVFVIAICLLQYACNRENDINDKSRRNIDWMWLVNEETGKGEWVKRGGGNLVQKGKYTLFYFNGNIYEIGRIKDERLIDTVYRYDLKGELLGYKIYDKNNDHVVYYLLDSGYMKDYYEEGSILEEGIIENHLPGKYWKEYDESGNLLFIVDIKGDSGVSITYHLNNKPDIILNGEFARLSGFLYMDSSRTYYDLQNGYALIHYESGIVKDSFTVKHGRANGVMYGWHPSGKVRAVALYKNGKPDSIATYFHENGKVKAIVSVRDGIPLGKSVFYDTNGHFQREVIK